MPDKTFRLPWRVVPYIAPSGSSDVLDYLEELKSRNRRQWERFDIIRREIELRGPFDIGGQIWEAVGDKLYEISWGRHRAYCSVEGERIVVMYVAVCKLWRKMRASDRSKCFSRRADFQSHDYDLQKREFLYMAHRQRRGK